MIIKTIYTSDFNADQSWCRTAIFEYDTHRLRVDIRYNAYAFQSHGRVDRWDGAKWQRVAEIPYPQLAGVSRHVSYGQKEAPRDSFDCDQSDLLDLAFAIIGV